MANDNDITLAFIVRQQARLLSELADIRSDILDMHKVFRSVTNAAVRLDKCLQQTVELLDETVERLEIVENAQ